MLILLTLALRPTSAAAMIFQDSVVPVGLLGRLKDCCLGISRFNKKISFFLKDHNYMLNWNFLARFFLNHFYSSRYVVCAVKL